jgi:iron(III) transport system ATP-binding protein
MMSSIRLINVEKAYGATGPKAVEDLSLTIDSGEFLCLLGPSGCGKTTTLRMLAGLEHPTGGEIRIGERTIVSVSRGIYVPPEKRGLGLVFQSYALWPHMSVRDNVEFGLKLRKEPKEHRRRVSDSVMEKLAIDRYAERYPNQLSGGQQQRVALARMLALQPEIILLDEPLSNLDAKLRLEMRAELKRIHREIGATIVFVTHDQWEAMTLASRIAVMSEGELQQVGSPDDIYDRPANRFVAEFVGSMPINIVTLSSGRTAGTLEHWLLEALAAMQAPDGVASVGIRPEALRIEPGPVGNGPLPRRTAEIVDVLPTGGSWIVELTVDGERIFAIAGTPPGVSAGDTVQLGLSPADIHLFDGTGRRMADRDAGAVVPKGESAPA